MGKHLHFNQPIVNEDPAAIDNIPGKVFIGDGRPLPGAGDFLCRQGETFPFLQLNPAFRKEPNPNLRAPGVQQSCYGKSQLPAETVNLLKPAFVIRLRGVGEVKPRHIHSSLHQLAENSVLFRGGSQCADDFGFSHTLFLSFLVFGNLCCSLGCFLRFHAQRDSTAHSSAIYSIHDSSGNYHPLMQPRT